MKFGRHLTAVVPSVLSAPAVAAEIKVLWLQRAQAVLQELRSSSSACPNKLVVSRARGALKQHRSRRVSRYDLACLTPP